MTKRFGKIALGVIYFVVCFIAAYYIFMKFSGWWTYIVGGALIMLALSKITVFFDSEEGIKDLTEDDQSHNDPIISQEFNMDIDEYDENGLTPLMKAANNGNYDEVKRLLELGADPDKTDKEFGTTKAEDLAGMKANDSAVHWKIQKLLIKSSPHSKTLYDGKRRLSENPYEDDTYGIGFSIITAVITFFACWIYAIASWGFLIGVGLGWIPSLVIAIIAAFIAAFLWPLIAIVLVVIVLLGFLVLIRQRDEKQERLPEKQERLSGSMIKPHDLIFEEVKLLPKYSNYELTGRIKNNSSYTLDWIGLKIIFRNCFYIDNECVIISEEEEYFYLIIPPGQTRYFSKTIYFNYEMQPKWQLTWDYNIIYIRAK